MMSRKKLKTNINFIVPFQVYPFDLMVSIAQTDIQLGRVLDRYHGLTERDIELVRWPSENTKGRYCMFSTGGSFMRLRKLPEIPEDYGHLAHEIFHVVTMVMDYIGTELVIMKSDEPYAYLIEYLTKEIYKRVNKYY